MLLFYVYHKICYYYFTLLYLFYVAFTTLFCIILSILYSLIHLIPLYISHVVTLCLQFLILTKIMFYVQHCSSLQLLYVDYNSLQLLYNSLEKVFAECHCTLRFMLSWLFLYSWFMWAFVLLCLLLISSFSHNAVCPPLCDS